MMNVSQTTFEDIVRKAIDGIPDKYYEHIKNLAFVVEDQPSPMQRKKLKLAENQSLYGLYEGVPLTKRGAGYNLVLPDKITIFMLPIQASANSYEELVDQVKETVWHEVAHFYGLDHGQIHSLQDK